MSLELKSNGKYIGNSLVSSDAPLPVNAIMFLDFENSQFVRKTAAGSVLRGNSAADVMSFQRASIATYVGNDGLIKYAAANEVVIEYDQNSLECLGFRAEYTATNRIVNSENYSAANWGQTGLTLTANDAIAPNGNKTATKIIESTSDTTTPSQRKLATSVSMAAVVGEPYTFSTFIKANTATKVQLAALAGVSSPQYANFDLSSGKVTLSTANLLQANIEKFPNGWFRCSITINPTVAEDPQFTIALINNNSASDVTPSYPSTSPGSVYIWASQAERAAGYTSYIPTSGGEVTRQADLMTTPTGYTLIDPTKGTCFALMKHPFSLKLLSTAYQSLACVFVLDNTEEGAHYRLAYRTRDNMYGQAAFGELNAVGGTNVSVNIPSLAPVSDSEQSAICLFNTASKTMKVYDGQVWAYANPATMPVSLNRLCVGRGYLGSTNWFTGHIKKIVYWAEELSEVQAEAYYNAL